LIVCCVHCYAVTLIIAFVDVNKTYLILSYLILFLRFCPHIKSDNGEIWREVRTWDTLPALNFVKSAQGDLSLGKIVFTKYSKFSRFLAI